jgi:glycerophosphoryl diester phosphodiesterase
VTLVAATTLAGSCLDAGYFTAFHRQRLQLLGEVEELPPMLVADHPAIDRRLGACSGRFAVGVTVALTAAAVFGALAAADALGRSHLVAVTAHRGCCLQGSPENTVAAVREAAHLGADVAEIDVQMSKDGALVVTHDSDFSRVAKVPRKVWDLTLEEIRSLALTEDSSPDRRVPTLEEVLAAADGVIKLNIELKYYGGHQPGLAAKVVDAVRRAGMTGVVVIQCLEYEALQQVRRAAPEIPVGYLMSFNARQPARLNVDFFSVEQSRADLGFIAAAHRRNQQVHAWTVDQPQDMAHLLDLGIDGLITNRPDLAVAQVRRHAGLLRHERAARRIRAWLTP